MRRAAQDAVAPGSPLEAAALEQIASGVVVPQFGSARLTSLRREGVARLAAGFPTTRDERWKYTNLNAVITRAFAPKVSVPAITQALRQRIAAQVMPLSTAAQLVFVDGHFVAELSHTQLAASRRGVQIAPLSQALRGPDGGVEELLGRAAAELSPAFVGLNTALFADGAAVVVAANTTLAAEDGVIDIVYVSTGADGSAGYPRTLLSLGAGARVSVVERFVGLDAAAAYLSAPVCEVLLAPGSFLAHARLQQEGAQATHVAAVAVGLDRDARYVAGSLMVGGLLSRQEMRVVLRGAGASCLVGGVFLARGRQHCDNHLEVLHTEPCGSSEQHYRGIVDEHGSGVFSGKVVVARNAQKTVARQINKNLVLARTAKVKTRPTFEILADDVVCSHGATVGQLDDAALFYLRSRGIDQAQARRTLTAAFATGALDAFADASVREAADTMVRRWLGEPAQPAVAVAQGGA